MIQPSHFISYSRDSGCRQFAERLFDALASGDPPLRGWLDVRCVHGAVGWESQISEAIARCESFLFVVSRHSVQRQSQCIGELHKARSCHKAIIPLLYETLDLSRPDEVATLLLGGLPHVDFTVDFDGALVELRRHLGFLLSPGGQQARLRSRVDDLERDLQRAAGERRRALIRVQLQHARELLGLMEAPEAQAAAPRPPAAAAWPGPSLEPHRAKLNERTADPFFDRESERDALRAFLSHPAQRLMVIHGRSGIGKTSVAAHALKAALQHASGGDPPAILFFSATSERVTGLTLTNLLQSLRDLVADQADVEPDLLDPQLSTAAKVQHLVDRLGGRRVVLLLDGIEDHAVARDGDATPGDDAAGLRQALLALLTLPSVHGVKMVVTSLQPVARLALAVDAGRCVLHAIDEGLPDEWARRLLRELDADGLCGLRDAADSTLDEVLKLTRRFPRALLAVHQSLRTSLTSIEDLLQGQDTEGRTHVVWHLVGAAFDRLPQEEQRVLQVLAIFGRPMEVDAIAEVVEPYLGGLSVRALVARLVRHRFVGRAERLYDMHSSDRDYALSVLPEGEPADRAAPPGTRFTAQALLRAAALYFRQLHKPREQWRSRDDLAPGLAEFDLLCRAGQVDEAAGRLLAMDETLMRWGYGHEVVACQQRILAHPLGVDTQRRCLASLGLAQADTGDYESAIASFARALNMAAVAGDPVAEVRCRHEIGSAQFYLNRIDLAVATEVDALALATSIGATDARESVRLQVRIRTRLCSCLTYLGRSDEAWRAAEDALNLFDALDGAEDGDRQQRNFALGVGAVALHHDGRTAEAVDAVEQALADARRLGYRLGEGLHLGNLAEFHIDLGNLDEACRMARDSIEIADRGHMGLLRHWSRTALALGLLGRAAAGAAGADMRREALAVARRAVEYDVPLNNASARMILGLCQLLEGEEEAARAAFRDTIATADRMLARTPGAFATLDAKAMALYGLHVLGGAGGAAADAVIEQARQVAGRPGHERRRRVVAGVLRRADSRRRLDAVVGLPSALPAQRG